MFLWQNRTQVFGTCCEQGWYQTDSNKIEIVKNFLVPNNFTKLRAFLGFQETFDILRKKLIQASVLIYSDYNMLDQALEAVLSQKRPNRQEHSVAYASKSLSPAEKNYRTLALEHLAIYWAVTKWKKYLSQKV
ncbi:hypothetical protein G9A89_001067 [Geosiphon pyriformis]|nr:hypothetical protein G9A89_001067 [Geosiphon pyriformis]